MKTKLRSADEFDPRLRISRRRSFSHCGAVIVITIALACSARAQQSDELRQQRQQLKTQYEQSTQDMQKRIAALEQQIADEKQAEAEGKRRNSIGG